MKENLAESEIKSDDVIFRQSFFRIQMYGDRKSNDLNFFICVELKEIVGLNQMKTNLTKNGRKFKRIFNDKIKI